MVVLASLILFQASYGVFAQGRPDSHVWEFLSAIQRNDTNTASQLLESHTNLIFSAYSSSRLPLLEAAAAGNVPLVKRLFELGADINAAGDTMMSVGMQNTALHWAVDRNHPGVCQFLLDAGANPNRMNANFSSPLHLAFSEHREDMANSLLDYGADPFLEKLYTNDKTTPFELAITRSDGKLVPRMLGQDSQHPLGNKSLIKSTPQKHPRQPVKTSADILAERGAALLAAAAQRGELEAVQALLKAGVSPKEKTGNGAPLIQIFAVTEASAARGNNFESNRWLQIRDLLIKNGADYDVFAATALGDIEQARRLSSADKNLAQTADQEGRTPLHWAVQNDQLPLTAFWLQAGVPPAATNLAGQTALHIAAGKNLVEHMKLLLAAHALTDVRDTNGWTPLDAATRAKQTEAIRLLLSEKSVVPPADRAIATPLHETAAGGNLAALAALTEATNNLEARNELGLTPLQVAVLNGHLGEAALLVDRGANVNVRDPDGNTLLHQILLQERHLNVHDRPPTNWLARMGQDPRREMYLKYLTVGQYEQGPNPVLQTASFLLACGIDARATNQAGQTAVQLVTGEKISRYIFFFEDDQAALLKLLGTGGGNVNEADANGDTALHRAGQDSTADRVAGLIAGGADVNATNHQGRTPLHKFAEKIYGWDLNENGTNEPFQLLVKSGANVNAQDNDGLTPLHVLALADTSFKKEATRLLLDARADPNLRDTHGRTPVHLFLSGKWPWSEAGECLEMLAKAGADISVKDDRRKTPLHYLAEIGGPSQSSLFFVHNVGDTFTAAKVDIEARDDEGNTPLHIAAKTGTYDVFNWLMKHRAGLDVTNNAGETPRLLAARDRNPFKSLPPNADTDVFQAVREGKLEALTALFRADPKVVNETNQFGQTPLRMAVMAHRTNVVEFLVQHGAK